MCISILTCTTDCVCVWFNLTSLSTLFQSYHDGAYQIAHLRWAIGGYGWQGRSWLWWVGHRWHRWPTGGVLPGLFMTEYCIEGTLISHQVQFGMTWLGLKPTTSCTPGEHSTTGRLGAATVDCGNCNHGYLLCYWGVEYVKKHIMRCSVALGFLKTLISIPT